MYLIQDIYKSNDKKIKGDKSTLSPLDKEFVEFVEKLITSKELEKYLLSTDENLLGEEGYISKQISFNSKTLSKINNFELSFDNNATVSIIITFWKTDKEYFFRITGGCEVLEIALFGPFTVPF